MHQTFSTRQSLLLLPALLLLLAAAPAWSQDTEPGEVNVYSHRQPFLVQPLFDAFEEETGIKVNTIFANRGLVERIRAEGRNSPADVILTTDIGRLQQAVDAGVTQSPHSAVLRTNIPAPWRDPQGHWFGLTRRARVAFVSSERTGVDALTYEQLADPQWRGRICTRDGQHPYNIALFSAAIAHMGENGARRWLQGLKDNLARSPAGNDRAQIKAIHAGECDIALGNSYYLGVMRNTAAAPEQKLWADAVRIVFPTFRDAGTHVNIAGMAMAKHAPNTQNAQTLMEFLSGAQAMRIYAETNYEYPVREDVPWSEDIAAWGRFEADRLPLGIIAAGRSAASRLVDSVGFND